MNLMNVAVWIGLAGFVVAGIVVMVNSVFPGTIDENYVEIGAGIIIIIISLIMLYDLRKNTPRREG